MTQAEYNNGACKTEEDAGGTNRTPHLTGYQNRVSSCPCLHSNGEYDSFNKTDDLQAKRTYRSNAESLGLAADVEVEGSGAFVVPCRGVVAVDAAGVVTFIQEGADVFILGA